MTSDGVPISPTSDCEDTRENTNHSVLVIKGSYDFRPQRIKSPPFFVRESAIIWLLLSYVSLQSGVTGAFSPPLQMPPLREQANSFRRGAPLFYFITGSDAGTAGRVDMYLKDRLVTFRSKASSETTKPFPAFKEVWDSLRQELPDGGRRFPSAELALKTLTFVMNKEFSSELAFDQDLFAAMGELLTPYAIQQDDPDCIVLNLGGGNTCEYAVGIARQKAPSEYLSYDEIAESEVSQWLDETDTADKETDTADEETVQTDASVPDHTACLFHNDMSWWSVTDCFSAVELRTSDSTCEGFDFDPLTGQMLPPAWFERHLALGQVTLLNLWFVLPCQAKRGVLTDGIPLTTIAGKKRRRKRRVYHHHQGEERSLPQVHQGVENKLCWVSGMLEVPEACGGMFEYSLQEFGPFSYDKDAKNFESVERAATLYVNTTWYGLVAAIQVQKMLAAGEVPLAVAASGQSLMMGDVKLDLQFCASPIPLAVAIQDPTTNLKISQGDLFRGRLNVSDVISNTKGKNVLDFRRGVKVLGSSDVLVKVSSTTVHHHSIKPSMARHSLLLALYDGDEGLINEISSVLQAAVPMGPNTMTIMNDMTKVGYEALTPTDHSDQLDVLWDAFQDLVVSALLPMARLNIIHAGIRPGMDETSSILCKLCTENGKVTKATMKLIDFESLVESDNWNTAFADGRDFQMEKGWDATTYLWWQCMAVAYTWKESLAQGSGLELMKSCLLFDLDGPAWMNKYRDRAKGKITSEVVEDTLVDLAKDFLAKQQQGH